MTDHHEDRHGHELYGVPVGHHIEEFPNGTELHLVGVPKDAQLPPVIRATAEQHLQAYMDQMLAASANGTEDAAIIATTVGMMSLVSENPVPAATLLAIAILEAAKLRSEVRALTGEKFGIPSDTAPVRRPRRKGPNPEFEGMPADWWGPR